MNKATILEAIKRTTASNGGSPLGERRFENETGIRKADWYGRYWRNWGEALQEAGFPPNRFGSTYDENYLIEQIISLTRELGRFPVRPDFLMKYNQDKEFPHFSSFGRRWTKATMVSKVVEYCERHPGCEDVLQLCPKVSAEPEATADERLPDAEDGYVYLAKSKHIYKIGKSRHPVRREYEFGLKLPDKTTLVHEIRTDDPTGIEKYWHQRFAEKRRNGEWFELTADDVRAFKRRKNFM
jgi:hypothetical protein